MRVWSWYCKILQTYWLIGNNVHTHAQYYLPFFWTKIVEKATIHDMIPRILMFEGMSLWPWEALYARLCMQDYARVSLQDSRSLYARLSLLEVICSLQAHCKPVKSSAMRHDAGASPCPHTHSNTHTHTPQE